MTTSHEAASLPAADENPSAPPARVCVPRAGGSEGCSACSAPRRYRRRLCRPCWERFHANGLPMPPRESHAQPVEEYLGRVLATLPRAVLGRAIEIALRGGP